METETQLNLTFFCLPAMFVCCMSRGLAVSPNEHDRDICEFKWKLSAAFYYDKLSIATW